jgi:uncharacterized membrane protein YfcA
MTGANIIFLILSLFGGVIAGLGGPGGFPVIIGLHTFTEINASIQAGTTSIIFAAATVTATGLYAYSGDLRKDLIYYMTLPTLLGTPTGVFFNQFLSKNFFGNIIGVLAIILGSLLIYRETKEIRPLMEIETDKLNGKLALSIVGFSVGCIGGLTGIGGPSLTIPVLIALGIPVLGAIGAGLAQGVVVTSSSAVSYTISGSYSSELAIMLGAPYILSQVVGWHIAQNTETKKLKIAVSIFLIPVGLYLLIF